MAFAHGSACRAAVVGPSGLLAIAESRGVGRRRNSIYFLWEPFGVPAVRSGAALSGFTLAFCVRIAPAPSAFFSPRPPRLVGGRVSAPDPGLARGFSPGEVGRVPAISRSASSPPGRPRRSAGRADQTAVVLRYARAAELVLASRAQGSRDPGRRRRPRPTSRRLMSAPFGRTGRGG